MTFSAKVLNDLTGVAQGYQNHINLCQSIVNEGRDEIMGDGLAASLSLQVHLGYAKELTEFLAEHGSKTVEAVADEIIQVLEPVKQDGAD